jgi:hypothetical protein
MSLFQRQEGIGGVDHQDSPGVASDLAEFLVDATEGKALLRAIEDAHSRVDETVTPHHRDVPQVGVGDE